MTHRGRLVLAASLLLPGMVAAQEPPDPMRATAFREAQRYVDCWMRDDLDCVQELTDRERLRAAGMAAELRRLVAVVDMRFVVADGADYARIEVAEPWPPFAIDGTLFTFVPFFDANVLERETDTVDGRASGDVIVGFLDLGYLIGASDDEGVSWRFIQVSDGSILRSDSIDRVIPGYGDGPRPEAGRIVLEQNPLRESRWLETTERRFVVVDGAIAYAVRFEIREGLEGPVDFTVSYENPGDEDRLKSSGSLEPGQRVLEWQSPPLRGFEIGETYTVEVEGKDPDSGARRFRHFEELLFLTTREVWLAVVAPPTDALPDPASGL